MKNLLSLLVVVALGASSAIAAGPAPMKDIDISGTSSKISSGTFSIQSGVIFQALAGSTVTLSGAVDASAATSFKVGTLTTATNASVIVDANGTGKLDIRDTITTGTNGDLVVAPNGSGKLDLRGAPLKAGTATAATAPLKFTLGVNLTTPEAGATEYDGSFFYGTNSTPTRLRFSTDANAVAISALDINWSLGASFSKTLAANSTITFSNTVDGRTIVVALTNTASNYTVTWTGVTWSGGTAPTQTVGAKTDVYTFTKLGSVIYGSAIQNF